MIFRTTGGADLIKLLVEKEELFLVLQPLMESWWFALEKNSSVFCIDACHSMQYFCCTGGNE